jgi:26S proteasome regulatory subunit N6
MAAIAQAAKIRSLDLFQKAVDQNALILKSDDLIAHHLEILYENMLESNLLKIIHPYSCVEIIHIAKMIALPVPVVEKKLSQMILDHRFSGMYTYIYIYIYIYLNIYIYIYMFICMYI